MLLSELTSFIDANRYKGRREAFGIKDTKNYLRWAFLHDYLFVAFDEGRIAGVAVNAAGRISLVWKFRQRYPNWENQKKWAVQFDKVVEISNKYINLIHTI
jgi:hypothetical protein